MLLLRYRGTILTFSLLLLASVLIGCTSRRETEDDSEPGAYPKFGTRGGTTELVKIMPGTATLKGRVTVTGMPPDALEKLNDSFLQTLEKAQDRLHCMSEAPPAQRHEQSWKVGPDNGLANVFVYIRPPKKSYFAIDPKDTRIEGMKKEVIIDQPHCVYVPHVAKLLTSFRDQNGKVESGQSLLIKNTAKMNHNVKYWDGNKQLSPGSDLPLSGLSPSYQPLLMSCSIHPWMNAHILVLDHPYAAITNEKGEFEIKNLPEGKVGLLVWHEKAKDGKPGFLTDNEARGTEIELKNGQAETREYTVTFKP